MVITKPRIFDGQNTEITKNNWRVPENTMVFCGTDLLYANQPTVI